MTTPDQSPADPSPADKAAADSTTTPGSDKAASASAAPEPAPPADKQTLGFQTEIRQLLDLMIHSLYSNREIFLRELISNASDACDKLRFLAIDDDKLYAGDSDLRIRIAVDPAARSLTISDNGIGMSRDEAVTNLGTIARSGTREFFSRLTGDAKVDSNLIGQFGVGFYSSFIVANRVVVESRAAGLPANEGVHWESEGTGEFTVETIDLPARGTSVTLYLRKTEGSGDEAKEFDSLLDPQKLRQIVRTYSDHISIPVEMKKLEWDDGKKAMVATDDWEVVNQARALWMRPKSDLSEQDYIDFYKHLTGDFEPPLAYTHNRVEGRTEYTQLLFVPRRPPFDMWDRLQRYGLRLYVRRVFIMADTEQLLPTYLRFIRGVVDSNDLPLNVSREILQESRDVKMIRDGNTRRVLAMLEDLAANKPDEYAIFWMGFGQALKEGVGEDPTNRDRIAGLLRFATTASVLTPAPSDPRDESSNQTVSLADYVKEMKPEQKGIYYVTGESEQAARNSPHLEIFRKKGIQVLVLSDRVDEWMLSFLHEFDGKPLVSVSRGALDLGELADQVEKEAAEAVATEFKPLVDRMEKALGDKVKNVRVSDRLTDSASCLVSDDGDISGTLERLLKQAGQKAPPRQPILELNPTHPLVRQLNRDSADTPEARFDEWADLLFDQALLAEGGTLADPAGFVKRMNDLLLSMSAPD